MAIDKKIIELDAFRALCAMAVIAIHATAAFTQTKECGVLQMSMASICHFAHFSIPGFVFISGMVLHNKYGSSINLVHYFKKRFWGIIPIYLLFSLFYVSFPFFIPFQQSRTTEWSFGKILYQLLTGGSYYHLWYFGIAFQLYTLFPAILWLYKKSRTISLWCAFLAQSLWDWYGSNAMAAIAKLAGHTSLQPPIFLEYILWFVFGFYFLEKKEQILQHTSTKVLFVLVMALSIARTLPIYYGLQSFQYYDIPDSYTDIITAINPFFYLATILLLYKASLAAARSKSIFSTALQSVGVFSLEIYMIHAFALLMLTRALDITPINLNHFLYYPMLWLGTLTLSYSFAVLYQKSKRALLPELNRPTPASS